MVIKSIYFFKKIRMILRCWRYRYKSEVASINYVRSYLKKNTTMLDIGANKGIFSIYMSRSAGKKGKVIAFEAQPELKEYLLRIKKYFSLKNQCLRIQHLLLHHQMILLLGAPLTSLSASTCS